ncbi:hypothetical protein E2C01_085026 [Portunus trituberculatus]|uniref:Uncharacterized protein n=1 Tax=Portunus trituberculatus TaxID=210409 RepID=A0A5B7JAV5_PORTR|nr:hypothetical protein [Portunus trituberculatus]
MERIQSPGSLYHGEQTRTERRKEYEEAEEWETNLECRRVKGSHNLNIEKESSEKLSSSSSSSITISSSFSSSSSSFSSSSSSSSRVINVRNSPPFSFGDSVTVTVVKNRLGTYLIQFQSAIKTLSVNVAKL